MVVYSLKYVSNKKPGQLNIQLPRFFIASFKKASRRLTLLLFYNFPYLVGLGSHDGVIGVSQRFENEPGGHEAQ